MQKKYDFREVEKKMQEFWSENNVYLYERNSSKQTYSIDTPPPTVSGKLHIGHIFSYTQAEMVARFKRMQGFNVFYPFGFDDNGLPTERLVERDECIRARDIGREEFIQRCIAITGKYEQEFEDLWKALGFSVDWSLKYKTIEPKAQRISQKSFLTLYKKGKAYMKESPVLWCTECNTSIAQAELETCEKKTLFHHIAFSVDNTQVIVATTRPELLYGCVCLFVHPGDERHRMIIGKTAVVPIYDEPIPILADEGVSPEKGTGVVMCATFGDRTDVEWFEKHHLPYKKVILPNGYIEEGVPFIGGLRVAEARKQIVKLLEQKGLITRTEEMVHTIASDERCGKVIEILPSRQWYIELLSNKKLFLDAAEKINWYPAHMKNRHQIWVQNLKWDWCISRQRFFGVPIPVWYCAYCGEIILPDEEILPVDPQNAKPCRACSCGHKEFIPEKAVFDTWATSSVTPFINNNWGEEDEGQLLPMSMRTQAHEIIRTWAFYSIVKSIYHTGDIPWKDIMICGFVLAKPGEKISKSKSNAHESPKELIEIHSADVIRYWAANSRLGTDTYFAVEELSAAAKFIIKLWNASRFCISHLQDFDPHLEIEVKPVDLWIIERCKETIFKAAALLEQYEVGLARQAIDTFFWKDFCDNYLEIVKERLYQPEIHGERERRSAQNALYECMLNILKCYAIYVPHITEHVYQEFFRPFEVSISLHRLRWEKEAVLNESLLRFGEKLKETIMEVRKFKSENNLSMKAELEEVVIADVKEYRALFEQTLMDIKACCRTDRVRIIP